MLSLIVDTEVGTVNTFAPIRGFPFSSNTFPEISLIPSLANNRVTLFSTFVPLPTETNNFWGVKPCLDKSTSYCPVGILAIIKFPSLSVIVLSVEGIVLTRTFATLKPLESFTCPLIYVTRLLSSAGFEQLTINERINKLITKYAFFKISPLLYLLAKIKICKLFVKFIFLCLENCIIVLR